MTITLDDVARAYLADEEYQKICQGRAKVRNASLPSLQAVIRRFIRAETNMQTFRTELEKTILSCGDRWGAIGPGFMMELSKFGKHHNDTSSAAEEQLRKILNGLNAQNVGQHIEQFYQFLLRERERLRREGKSSSMIVAASNSALIVSLFAYWLDPAGEPIVYHNGVRKGLYILIKAQILPEPHGLVMGPQAVEVATEANHKACVQLVADIAAQVPQVKISTSWIEFFCFWIMWHFQSLSASTNTLTKETDENSLLASTPTKPALVREISSDYTFSPPLSQQTSEEAAETSRFIQNAPLRPTPEPLLSQLIREVQRYILVEEAVIRRIYHALLAGHVILTGPPGTGKTELARLIPEILWKSEGKTVEASSQTIQEEDGHGAWDSRTAYTTRLVTATDEWSVRTLISGLAPQSKNGTVTYTVQYGHLTSTILKNWSFQGTNPEEWSTVTLQRTLITTTSGIERGTQQQFRGQWLVIDEFNRAPIDLALGDALTALGGNDVLRVSIEGGSAELPIPLDFRVIGTLNSFDRNYLNQISEALKRRFSFVEILPPTRALRAAEQSIVLYKALKRISHLSEAISINDEGDLYWSERAGIGPDTSGQYSILWEDGSEAQAFREAFETAWYIFEVIRIYRQLGTAQAISLIRHMLIAGILQGYTTRAEWIEKALDAALCDTLADQLQVLLPDEIETLLLYLSTKHANFSEAYHALLARLTNTPHRLYGQLLSLGSVSNTDGQTFLSDAEIEQIASQNKPEIPSARLSQLFHLDTTDVHLPQFTRRLRTFKAERGL